jgi:hypothetical protein
MKKNLPESRDGFHVRESEYKLPEDDLTLDHQNQTRGPRSATFS